MPDPPVLEEASLAPTNEDLELVKVITRDQIEIENEIRRIVFVIEQNVDPDIEYDEFEEPSVHFLLYKDGIPIGCSRYRWVGESIKLERYALYKEERGKGYGRFIMDRMLEIVLSLDPGRIYLHSQVTAQGFYERCGFMPYGSIFKEADIDHIKMYYPLQK
jgi:predicted GNAT family N-acyltransferase